MNIIAPPRLAALIVLIAASTFAADSKPEFAVSELEQSVIDLTNQERQKAGLPELKLNPQLQDAARQHAANMARQEKLEHKLDGKSHSDRITAAGYKWSSARENIAWNQHSPTEVLKGWMESQGHRVNILAKDVTDIGVAAVPDAKGRIYWVQEFAKQMADTRDIRFSILNSTGQAIQVDTGTGKLSRVAPGDKVNYTLTTIENPALITVKSDGIDTLTFQLENNGKYKLGKDGKSFIFIGSDQ